MPWDPEIYDKFKNIRYKPFYDLADLVRPVENMKVLDLGCGTGEQTAILAERFKSANFLGIDSSAEMLESSKLSRRKNLQFQIASTEDMVGSGEKWDLVFSNAALQWSDSHKKLFPQLLDLINPDGQFAVQMPVQKENRLNRILFDLVGEKPFVDYLDGWRRDSPVLGIDEYAEILFEAGFEDIQISQKAYPIIANDHETLYNFILGSALIPYMERLEGRQKDFFIETFKERISKEFRKLPAIYAFKRLLIYGKKS